MSAGRKRAALVLVALAAALVDPATAPADQPTALERRVEQLERENRELRERLERLEKAQPVAAPAATPSPQPAPPVLAGEESPPPSGAELEEPVVPGLGLVAHYGSVRASFQLFGDVDFVYQNPALPEGANTAFVLGALDLFTTAQFGEHVQVLTELTGEGSSEENHLELELERLWAAYLLNDLLYLKLGREHSPVSRWNRLYHHGRWLWPSATQPLLAQFEDEEGILPIHQIGLEAGGRWASAAGDISYIGVVANGRAALPDEVPDFFDENDAKSFDLNLGWSPSPISHFAVGGDLHADEIPDLPSDPARQKQIRELIGSGYVQWSGGRFDVLGEFAYISHLARAQERTYGNYAGYLQAGYHIGDWMPYLRFDGRDMALGDPYFKSDDTDLSGWDQVFGLRWDLTDNCAVKFEATTGRGQRRDANGVVSRGSLNRFVGQFAWVY